MNVSHPDIRCRRNARGFSLIEVLLAVLVLGLGLLGLAAVFPVVISQQREAVDDVASVAAAASVEAAVDTTAVLDGLEAILDMPGFSRLPVAPAGPTDEDWTALGTFLWQPTWSWNGQDAADRLLEEGVTVAGDGTVIRWDPTLPTPGFVNIPVGDPLHPGVTEIPISSRLIPSPYSGAAPQFVWDLVPRRTPDNRLQVAIFIRRIDTGIRVPSDYTLTDVVSQQRPTADVPLSVWTLPVGMSDADGRPSGRGAPFRSGGGRDPIYAAPIVLGAEVYDDPNILNNEESFDRLILRDPGPDEPQGLSLSYGENDIPLRAAAREGQILVDNLGQVREVLGEDTDANVGGARVVRVRPAFTASQAASLTSSSPGTREYNATVVRQVVFTTKPPARVIVRTVGR